MKFLLTLFLLIPCLSWGEDFKEKKFLCQQKELLEETSVISSQIFNNGEEVYLYQNQIPLPNYDKKWLFFGFEFLDNNKIRVYDTTTTVDDRFEYIYYPYDFIEEISMGRFSIIPTYLEKGFTKNEILAYMKKTVIDYISSYTEYEKELRRINYNFLSEYNLINLINEERLKFLWRDISGTKDPAYNIYIDIDGDGQSWQELTNTKNRNAVFKPTKTHNVIFGELLHRILEYDYYFDDETIYLKLNNNEVGKIDRYTLNLNLFENYEYSLCDLTPIILANFNIYKDSSEKYFKDMENYERIYYQKYEMKDEPKKKELKDRKI